jgi:hypothetical protein
MPIILALRKLRHEGNKFGACLGCTIMPCLKKKERKRKKKNRKYSITWTRVTDSCGVGKVSSGTVCNDLRLD